MSKITLDNTGPVDCTIPNLYYPRLQINKHGEIVLAFSKENGLTRGILVGKTKECKSVFSIGKKFTDWEVVGELTDYNGEVTISIENEVANETVS